MDIIDKREISSDLRLQRPRIIYYDQMIQKMILFLANNAWSHHWIIVKSPVQSQK